VVCFILLSGERPFECIEIPNQPDAGKSSLVSNILMGRYSFRGVAWDCIDDESIKFVQCCLCMDYKKRMTAAELQKLDWCSPETANRTMLSEKAATTLTKRLSRATSTGLNRTSMLAVAFSMPSSKAREMRSLFQQIDVDGSGQVDRVEFKTALRVAEPNMSDDDIDRLFEAIDQDGNEEISFLEFVAAMVDPREVDISEINQVSRDQFAFTL
jgi:calcium-dependent protein kinase